MSGLDEKAIAIAESAYLAAPSGEDGLRVFLRAYLAATTPADVGELVERLKHLIALDEPKNGGPYGGLAARECLRAMTEAATALERVTRERDEARATLDEICLSNRQEWQRATTAEAKLAEARKVIEPFALCSVEGLVPNQTGYIKITTCAEYYHAARRFLEETK